MLFMLVLSCLVHFEDGFLCLGNEGISIPSSAREMDARIRTARGMYPFFSRCDCNSNAGPSPVQALFGNCLEHEKENVPCLLTASNAFSFIG